MKQKDIRILVERGLHTQGYVRYANLDPKILDLILYKSANELLDTILGQIRYGVGFEDTTLRIEDTATLKGKATISPSNYDTNAFQYDMSTATDYRDWIRMSVKVTSKYYKEPRFVKVRLYEESNIDNFFIDTYHKTSYDSPLCIIDNNVAVVFTGGEFQVGDAKLSYLKKIQEFDVVGKADDEYPLSSRFINTIIDRTVQAILINDRIIREQNLQQVQSN